MKRLSVVSQETNKNITVARRVRSPVVGTLKDEPTSFGDLTNRLDYLFIEGSPLDVIKG